MNFDSTRNKLSKEIIILLLIILDEALKELVNFMFEKRNQNITQVFTPLTHCNAHVVFDFQDTALPDPIHIKDYI